ncbi:MAG: hypothetical protein WDZ76_00210 [Pseudohongiellaceae bacterium]
MHSNPVIGALPDLHTLECLYQQDPEAFSRHLDQALQLHPHAQVLHFWHTRLYWNRENSQAHAQTGSAQVFRSLLFVIILGLVATMMVKLPSLLPLDPEWYYPRFAPFIVLTALIVWFCRQEKSFRHPDGVLLTGILGVGALLLVLPDYRGSASATMALIHVPLILWCGLGLAFTRDQWRGDSQRLAFIRYNGELLVYVALLLLGGIVMTACTVALFGVTGVDIEQWYLRNVVVAGVVSAPLVATFIYEVLLRRDSRIASLIARIFAPLFLVTVCGYLIAMSIGQNSPYTDRDFLITFNALLLLVLGITVFSVSDRGDQRSSLPMDAVNLLLISVTLLIDAVALSAIVFRLAEYGMTPNRFVVLGANLLIFVHLCLLLQAYWRTLRTTQRHQELVKAVTGFLPVYGAWAVFVVVGVPVIFWGS